MNSSACSGRRPGPPPTQLGLQRSPEPSQHRLCPQDQGWSPPLVFMARASVPGAAAANPDPRSSWKLNLWVPFPLRVSQGLPEVNPCSGHVCPCDSQSTAGFGPAQCDRPPSGCDLGAVCDHPWGQQLPRAAFGAAPTFCRCWQLPVPSLPGRVLSSPFPKSLEPAQRNTRATKPR